MAIGLKGGISFPDSGPGGDGTPPPHLTGVVFDKDVPSGKQYKMNFSDGTSYPFIIPPQSLDFGDLTNNYLPVYNARTKKLEDSDIRVVEQLVDMSSSNISIGTHIISSLGENVGFTDMMSRDTKVPLWQYFRSRSGLGYVRQYAGKESITIQGNTDDVIINPDFNVSVTNDETIYQVRISFKEATPGGILIKAFYKNRGMIVRSFDKDFPAGRVTLALDPGFDLSAATIYRIKIERKDGKDLKLKGLVDYPFMMATRAKWKDLVVADRDWVDDHYVKKTVVSRLRSDLRKAQDDIAKLEKGQSGMQSDQAVQGNELGALQKEVSGKVWTIPDIVTHLKNLGYRPTANTGGDTPEVSDTSAYAFFQRSGTAPPTLPQGLPLFRKGRVVVSKTTNDPAYVFILLPPGEGAEVDKISESGGLPSIWPKESKVYDGRTYTVLRSPYPFAERDLTLFLHD